MGSKLKPLLMVTVSVSLTSVALVTPAGSEMFAEPPPTNAGFGMLWPFAAEHAAQSWPRVRAIDVDVGETVIRKALLSLVALTPDGRNVLTEIVVFLAGTFHSVV